MLELLLQVSFRAAYPTLELMGDIRPLLWVFVVRPWDVASQASVSSTGILSIQQLYQGIGAGRDLSGLIDYCDVHMTKSLMVQCRWSDAHIHRYVGAYSDAYAWKGAG